MMHALAIVCILAAQPSLGGPPGAEILPPGAIAGRAAAEDETALATSNFTAEPATARPVRGLAARLYRLWKPVSPLGRAYGPGEFPYRSWYKHPYLEYRGNYFRGHYDYHRLLDYPWHAPVSAPIVFSPIAQRADHGSPPTGTIVLPLGGTAQPAPLGRRPALEHPDAVVPE